MTYNFMKFDISDFGPSQMDIIDVDKDRRLFKAWLSVEARDKEGEFIPMSELKKTFPIMMRRGADIMDSHSSKKVGKFVKYEFKVHPVTKTEGLFVTGEIFSDYRSDDRVWDEMKSGQKRGMSFAGASDQPILVEENGVMVNKLTNVEGDEGSMVDNPANQFSNVTDLNFFAKGESDDAYQLNKKNKEVIDMGKEISNGSTVMSTKKIMVPKDAKKQEGVGLEERLAALEGAVKEILERFSQDPAEPVDQVEMGKEDDEEDKEDKEDEIDKEDDDEEDKEKTTVDEDREDKEKVKKEDIESDASNAENVKLPATASDEDIQDEPIASEEVKVTEKSMKRILKQLNQIKKSLPSVKGSRESHSTARQFEKKEDHTMDAYKIAKGIIPGPTHDPAASRFDGMRRNLASYDSFMKYKSTEGK